MTERMPDRERRLRMRIDSMAAERDAALAERDVARNDLAELEEEIRRWPLAQLAARRFVAEMLP